MLGLQGDGFFAIQHFSTEFFDRMCKRDLQPQVFLVIIKY